MARTKRIAPTLEWVLEQRDNDLDKDGLRTQRAAEAELRALLAVARAAEDHSHADVEYDPVSEKHLCPICRALSRLSRASQPRAAPSPGEEPR
jgi:hypothetical protein